MSHGTTRILLCDLDELRLGLFVAEGMHERDAALESLLGVGRAGDRKRNVAELFGGIVMCACISSQNADPRKENKTLTQASRQATAFPLTIFTPSECDTYFTPNAEAEGPKRSSKTAGALEESSKIVYQGRPTNFSMILQRHASEPFRLVKERDH